MASLLALLLSAVVLFASSPSDMAWGENIGWLNAEHQYQPLVVRFDAVQGWLTGYLWGENIGWIKMGSSNGGPYANAVPDRWGVNLSMDGTLSGYAWGENIGWINFDHPHCDAEIDFSTGLFSGHAWCENVGWIKWGDLGNGIGIRTIAFQTQMQGTPNWWLEKHDIHESYDAGDGVTAWRKYVMDVDPTISGNALFVSSVTNSVNGFEFVVSPSSSRRFYTLLRRESLMYGSWSNVVDQVSIPGNDGALTLVDQNAPERAYYTVRVSVDP